MEFSTGSFGWSLLRDRPEASAKEMATGASSKVTGGHQLKGASDDAN
jgi:hypothetical protein